MEVDFSPEFQSRLTQRAQQQGRQPGEFVQDVIERYLEEEDRILEGVARGEEAVQRGEYLTHDQVGDRLKRFLQS